MRHIVTLLCILCSFSFFGQSWKKLHNAPSIRGKQDDLFFITSKLGWSVNGQGYIFKTYDGGQHWDTLLHKSGTYFRCILFTDSLNGFAGNIGTDYYPGVKDTIPLYQTHNGGKTWSPVTNIQGPIVKGICNLSAMDKMHIYATGRVGGPCFMMKTSDGGKTWTSQDLSNDMMMLIDARFTSSSEGIVVGQSHNNRSLILGTYDGGQTWEKKFESKDTMELCWKIDFPSSKVGYISVTCYDSTSTFIKTTDGGKTWQEHRFLDIGYKGRGIGFINETTGWIAGEGMEIPPYKTTDGGKTWKQDHSLGTYINRFRFVDGVGYAIGSSIYKILYNDK